MSLSPAEVGTQITLETTLSKDQAETEFQGSIIASSPSADVDDITMIVRGRWAASFSFRTEAKAYSSWILVAHRHDRSSDPSSRPCSAEIKSQSTIG